MKKFLPGAIVLMLLATTSCNKTDDTEEGTTTVLNTWSVGKTTYKSVTVGGGENVLTAANAESGNAITFSFPGKSLPKLGGIYAIKNSAPGTNEVMVAASDKSTQGAYLIMSGTLTVTMKAGKVVIDLPPTTGKYVGDANKPNEDISAHIEQP